MQIDAALFLGEGSLQLERLEAEGNHVSLFGSTTAPTAECPICGRVSGRVHSYYSRTVYDLPWHGAPVTLQLRIRRFFCGHNGCRRVIFAERLPEVAGDYARKTARLESALSALVTRPPESGPVTRVRPRRGGGLPARREAWAHQQP